jgi:hypothetical protein
MFRKQYFTYVVKSPFFGAISSTAKPPLMHASLIGLIPGAVLCINEIYLQTTETECVCGCQHLLHGHEIHNKSITDKVKLIAKRDGYGPEFVYNNCLGTHYPNGTHLNGTCPTFGTRCPIVP